MNEKTKNGRIIFCCFICALVFAGFGATQYVAAHLDYQEALPWSLYETVTFRLYAPFAFFHWFYLFHNEVPRLFEKGFLIFAYGFFLLCILIFILRHWLQPKTSTNYGSARWATKEEIKETKLLDGKGIFLGVLPSGEYLRDNEATHDLITAPTRGGKGVGLIQPTALTWPHSFFIIDPKAECWGYTAGYRQEKLNNIVYKFEPAEYDSHHFNPFDEIRFGTGKEFKDCSNLAIIQCDPSGQQIGTPNGYWAEAASQLMTGILLHIKYTEGYVSPISLLEWLTDLQPGDDTLQSKLLRCADAVHDADGKILRRVYKTDSQTHPRVKQIFTRMGTTPGKEFGSIYSSLDTALNLYRDAIIAENTRFSDFAIHDVMNDKRPVSVYFVVSPDDLGRLGPLMRMMTELMYRRNVEKLETDKKKHRLLMLIDEFPALGKLENFEKALAFVAGYGIKSVLVIQGINQLNKLYSENNSIFDNAHVRLFFTPNDAKTPKFLSEMLGKKTIRIRNRSYNGSVFQFLPMSINEQETGRELMRSDEVSKMDAKNGILFVAGHPPIYSEKIKWYEDDNFRHRQMPPPEIPIKTDAEIEAHIERIKETWRELALQRFDEENKLRTSAVYGDLVDDDALINPFA